MKTACHVDVSYGGGSVRAEIVKDDVEIQGMVVPGKDIGQVFSS